MRIGVAMGCITGAALAGAFLGEPAFAQRGAASEQAAISYIYSAFITQADPGVMARSVTLGPELEKRLGLAAGSEGAKVYRALIDAAEGRRVDVRKATTEEIAGYGMRRGFDPNSRHPLYTLEAGDQKFLVQYDLQALSIPFVGQLGVPDPEPRVIVTPKITEPIKPEPLTFAWTELFDFDRVTLSEVGRARLDAEIAPKLAGVELRYLSISGHSDRLGSPEYNQRLSEKRAEALREYFIAKGVNPERIEIFGYGQTLPVKACPEEKKLAALVECLAPNRRVVVELHALPRP
jgi:outer membrane protein OmpA-like peptidoglycan-associated protein